MHPPRFALRLLRAAMEPMDGPWRHLVVAMLVGALGAMSVEAFRRVLFGLEGALVGAQGGHLVAAAQALAPQWRLAIPALGGACAGLVLWFGQRHRKAAPTPHGGDYIEAVAIGDGRLDMVGGALKIAASLLVVSSGGAVGREGAMVLLSAMIASLTGLLFGRAVNLRLVVCCGAAAGLAAAYRAPLASSVFVAEVLLGSMALGHLGPVVVSSVVAYGLTTARAGGGTLFTVGPAAASLPEAGVGVALIIFGTSVLAGGAGAGLLRWLEFTRSAFRRTRLPAPLALALGGLLVGLLSLWRPEVWGNGYSAVEQQLTGGLAWQVVALVLVLKLLAIGATTGSGAPGGVFTPTLFVGAAFGALGAAALPALGLPSGGGAFYALLGMASLLAATTHAPVMAALMVVEMTGRYEMLAVLLPACVVAALVSRRLHTASVYGLDAHAPREALKPY